MTELKDKITYLEKQNKIFINDLKKEKYPEGSIVYVIDYTDEENNMYRIGISSDMKKRKALYDTHTIHKKNIVIME